MADSEGEDMRMTTGEQLREVAAALKQDQRNYLHEVEQGKARIAELEAELAATVKDSLTVGKAQMARDSAELRRLCAERDKLKAKAAVPDGWKLVKVGVEGVRFGNAWYSHEKITGYSADQLNAGHCGIAGRGYMEWLAAAPAQPAAPEVVWCEVHPSDLDSIEETKPDQQRSN